MKNRKISLFIVMACVACMLCACSQGDDLPEPVKKDEYSKFEYRTCEVIKGEFVPQIKLTLQDQKFEKINYQMLKEELELDKLHVSIGDKVKKGDVLVSFKSEEIENELKGYIEQKENMEMLIEHYRRIMQIDKSIDYTGEIQMLSEDISVNDLYIEELTGVLNSYSIVAKRSGVITDINKCIANGYYEPSSSMVTQICSSGKYTVNVEDDSMYSVGQIYEGYSGKIKCNLKLIKKKNGKLVFKTMEDIAAMLDTSVLEVDITKESIEDAVYIETAALCKGDEQYFVYVVDENGFREKRDVILGDTYNGYTMIKNGLEPGEKVTY